MSVEELVESAPAQVAASIEVDGVHLTAPIAVASHASAMRWANLLALTLMGGSAASLFAFEPQAAGPIFLTTAALGVGTLTGGAWLWNRRTRREIIVGPRELRIGDRRWPLHSVGVLAVDTGDEEHELRIRLGEEIWVLNGAVSGRAATDNAVVDWVRRLVEEAVADAPLAREQAGEIPSELEKLRGRQRESE